MARILVVDDHASIRRLITLSLEDRGHDCEEAADGSQALDALGNSDFDAMILDLMMPDIDGFEVLECLADNSVLPILVLTATARPDAESVALEAGATAVLRKPFDPDEIAITIDRLVEDGRSASS